MKTFLCVLSVVVLLSACATNDVNTANTFKAPINVQDRGSEPIAFRGVVMNIPAGTEVGTVYGGILHIPHRTIRLEADLVVPTQEFNLMANEQLKTLGYTVLARTSDNLLFGKDESGKASYWLGGTIVGVRYDEWWIEGTSVSKEMSMTVNWQVFDALNQKVVFKSTTTGLKTSNLSAAFRTAMLGLLADEDFVAAVAKRSTQEAANQQPSVSPILVNNIAAPERVPLPLEIDRAMGAIVVLRVGGVLGSGVIVSPDGYILTAAHVVTGVKDVTVRFKSGLTLNAGVVRVDTPQDIALLKLPGTGHPCLRVATGATPGIGTDLFAIGAPQSEEYAFSVSKGIVSGHRVLDGFQFIQTDASLNPGNSGGPLLDNEGRIIGIVSWKIVESGFEGLAFGVPVPAIAKKLGLEFK